MASNPSVIPGAGSGVYVPQPQVGSIRYGLFAAANGVQDLPHHGSIGGVQYLAEHCGTGHLWPAPTCSGVTQTKPMDACLTSVYGFPFNVIASFQTGAFPYSEADIERLVRVRLNDNAQQMCEQALWGGNTGIAGAPPLASVLSTTGNGFTLTDLGTATSFADGVGLLENFLANYSYPGILHAQPYVAPFAAERHMKEVKNNVYKTPMGNSWSFGRGYGGKKPSDDTTAATAGNAYIVATGPVTIYRDPTVYVNPIYRSMDRSANQLEALAEQAYAITVECVAAFALVPMVGM